MNADSKGSCTSGCAIGGFTRRKAVLLSVITIITAVALGWLVWREYFQTYHFRTVRAGVLYRCGNRSIREFSSTCRMVCPKTVVVLVSNEEFQQPEFQRELAYCRAKQMELVHLPLPGGWPTTADVRTFLSIATNPNRTPVLVHCAGGVRRTSMMVAAYRMSVEGYSSERALADVPSFARRERVMPDVAWFVRNYDPLRQIIAARPEATAPSYAAHN